MQSNEWKTASQQLLSHWKRCGISQIPSANPESIAQAVEWLKANSATVFQQTAVPPPTSQPAVLDTHSLSQPTAVSTNSVPVPSSFSQAVTAALGSSVDTQATAPNSVHSGVSGSGSVPTAPVGAEISIPRVWATEKLDAAGREDSLRLLNDQVRACRNCEEIVCRRQQTVFGVGPTNARVVMFGEAPGADEDRLGEPFVGAAGQLLDKIIVASGMKREEVYIMNALKCRPPNNRVPSDAEIENCRPFFEAQLEAIQPDYIVCWGAIAVRAVLKSTDSVGRLRGKFHSYRGAKVLVTYHPAYLLRTPDAKRLTWEDMKMLMAEMGIPIPGKK
jgi:DNA polymerase